MATGVQSWSKTAASNASADSNVNYAEGQTPSSLNDSARAAMASVAKWRDDISGTITTGGSSTAYTVTTNQSFASLSAMDGALIAFSPHTTCGAAPTLAVDGLAAKALNAVSGTAVVSGSLVGGGVYVFKYVNSSTEFIQVGGSSGTFASGTVMVFVQTSAPTGWTKGSTHNDKALRIVTGSASTGGSTAFSTVFASRTIAQANLPNVTLSAASLSLTSGTVTITGGTFGGTSASVASNVGAGGSPTVPLTATAIAGSVGTGISGNVPLGGSGTAIDFAVNYVDCILATKN